VRLPKIEDEDGVESLAGSMLAVEVAVDLHTDWALNTRICLRLMANYALLKA
jgi:hypothetical protein